MTRPGETSARKGDNRKHTRKYNDENKKKNRKVERKKELKKSHIQQQRSSDKGALNKGKQCKLSKQRMSDHVAEIHQRSRKTAQHGQNS